MPCGSTSTTRPASGRGGVHPLVHHPCGLKSPLRSPTGTGPRLQSTPAGDVELKVPKLRTGSFFTSLQERRRRIDRGSP